MTEETFDDETIDELETFFREAIARILEREDSEAFLAWVRQEAADRLPRLFERLPDEAARRSSASELGRALWSSVPLPGNGFRSRPLPEPERNDPCPCGSGLKYKKCCAPWAAEVPSFDPEGIWRLVVEALPLEQVEALGQSGRVPRHLVGDLATSFLDDGDPERALALVQPMFDRSDRLDDRDAAALNAFLEAHDHLDLLEEKAAAVERLAKSLKPALRAVLWENQVRAHAVEGELDEAWAALEKARQDDPESAALGPLEVSLLMSEGRTAEAGERARFFRERFRREPGMITEVGMEFLDKVAADPEAAQLEFSLGEEVKDGILRLQELLARLPAPAATYEIQRIGDSGAGRLAPPAALQRAEEGWDQAFFGAVPELDSDGDEENDEDDELDPWSEEDAARWLAYLLDEPAALDSVEILEDLAHSVSELGLDRYPFLDRRLLKPVLDRGLAAVRQALAAHPGITRLPDNAEPNGSALALIVAAAIQAERLGEPDRGRELRQWLDVLDPGGVEEGEEIP
ncbi:MAG: SEC-C domain-containing protein [Acidobacteria bacterium]|nr:SEC-C domain-containing protein [Acidobacteriota bacterium]